MELSLSSKASSYVSQECFSTVLRMLANTKASGEIPHEWQALGNMQSKPSALGEMEVCQSLMVVGSFGCVQWTGLIAVCASNATLTAVRVGTEILIS